MIERLIAESTEFEYKVGVELKKPRSWLKTVSAYANCIGGIILFGIDNSGNKIGIDNIQMNAEKISEFIKERIVPIPVFNLKPIQEKELNFLALVIASGTQTPYYYKADGNMEVFMRIGNESIKAPDYTINELILKGTNKSYDSLVTNTPKTDYSFTLLEATYREQSGLYFGLGDYVSFGLSTKDGLLTNAGKLLADQYCIYNSRLFCTRWNGLEKGSVFDDAIDDKEYEGNLIHLLSSGISFVKNNSKVRFEKRGYYRLDKPDYSLRAISEAIVNALIHRDYLIMGREIHIDMFDDRIEITSPGGMYVGQTIQEYEIDEVSSIRRNPIVADLFHRMKYMERRGSGLKKIIAETSKLPGYKSDLIPTFISTESRFIVVIKGMNGETMKSLAQAKQEEVKKNKQTPQAEQEKVEENKLTPQAEQEKVEENKLTPQAKQEKVVKNKQTPQAKQEKVVKNKQTPQAKQEKVEENKLTPQAEQEKVEKNKQTPQANGNELDFVKDKLLKVLIFCEQPRTKKEIMFFCQLEDRNNFTKTILNPMIRDKKLVMTIPDKPTSPNQRYVLNKEE